MKNDPIATAQQQLLAHPYDIYHNIFHHYKVWENTRAITFSENLNPNVEALDIACWWHDIFRGDENNDRLRAALQATSIPPELLTQVVDIIAEHSFGQDQTRLESRILFDADKLEYISLPRWQLAFEAFQKGLITGEEKERYVLAWNKRVPSLRGKLYFSYSNKRYEENFATFVEWLQTIGRYKDESFT